MYFFYNMVERMFPRFTGFYTVHGPSPLKKTTYETLWKLEPDLLETVCSHPFRHREDINQYVLREYQKLSGEFVPRNVKKICRYFDLEETNPVLVETIVKQKAPSVCINDSNKEIPFLKVQQEIQVAFEEILPEKCSYER